jgi:acetyl esterase/lipase
MHLHCFPHPLRFGVTVRFAVVAAGLVAMTVSTASCDEKPSPAAPTPTSVQLPDGVKMDRDIAYVPDGDDAQKLDLYLPETPAGHPLPLIVHIHGGGWRGGNKFPCPVVGMVAQGYVVASVEYRFSQKALFPAQIQDCQAAIRWLRANSTRHGIDPEHIGVIGASAGGHLSALVGTAGGTKAFPPLGGNEEQSDRVQAVCDIYGPTDFGTVMRQAADDRNVRNIFTFNSSSDPYSLLIGASLEGNPDKTDAVSPVYYASKDSPPTLILHGTHDALVPFAQSEEFAATLEEKGVAVWLQALPGSGHGGPAFGKPSIIGLMKTFFDKHLKGTDMTIDLVPPEDIAIEPSPPGAK